MRAPVDWSKLTHAYGPATDIPGLIQQLRTAPAGSTYNDQPWFRLWSALCHQGDVYTASFAALPELVDIAADREPAVAVDCLYLAAIIELERHNITALPIPAALRQAYDQGLKQMRAIASRLPSADLSKERRARLAVVRAVADAQLADARRLVDSD